MIPSYVLETVYDLLAEQNQGSLENTLKAYQKKCTADNYNLFNPCFILVQALCDNVFKLRVLTRSQRLLAIFLVSESFKPENTSPFTQSLLDVYDKAIDQYERKMIYDLVVKGWRDQYGYKTMKTLVEEQDKFFEEFKADEEIEQMKKFLQDQRIPTTATTQVRHVVADNMSIDKQNDPPQTMPFFEKVNQLDREYLGFEPDFLRPVPTALQMIPEDDLHWFDAGVFFDVQWDYNICVTSNALSVVKELLQKAYQTQLNTEETRVLTDAFKTDALVKNCGFTPNLLPDLVERNPTLASLLLNKLHQQPNIEEYFEKLSQIDVTLSSLEVVNKLVNTMLLPKEYLQFFITTCIHQCQSQKEKSNLTRLVRLVCVFIKAMIKQKNFNPKDMYIELQAFCIENSKISEATALFKQLKSMDHQQGLN